jgi:hypothetical protein
MSEPTNPTRRRFLKISGAALAAIPVLAVSGRVLAAQNAAVRTTLQYQPTAKDGKSCTSCVNYLADKKGCTLFPGDTEIAGTGWCLGYIAKT